MDWIMSEGGPLICMERPFEASWSGVFGLSVAAPNIATDYDRACQSSQYTTNIPVPGGSALVLGSGSLDTAFWRSASGTPFIVSVFCSEPDVDEERLLAEMPESIFAMPVRSIEIRFMSPELILFDSAESGKNTKKKVLSFYLDPGPYRIATQEYNPNKEISFLVHRFQHLG